MRHRAGARPWARGSATARTRPRPPEHWMVEYSAPNTNKPLHLGHLRNNLLGCVGGPHPGLLRPPRSPGSTWSTTAACTSASRCWPTSAGAKGPIPEASGKKGDHLVGDFYVLFDQQLLRGVRGLAGRPEPRPRSWPTWLASKAGQQAQKAARQRPGQARRPERPSSTSYKDTYFNSDSPLGAEARELLRRWEEEDPEVRALWRTMNDWVLAGFDAELRAHGRGLRPRAVREPRPTSWASRWWSRGWTQGVLQRLRGRRGGLRPDQGGAQGRRRCCCALTAPAST